MAGARAARGERRRERADRAVARSHDRLRRDCPWDREQTEPIVPHTVEEAYEVAEGAGRAAGAPELVDELGDLLFQTYFLALLAREAGAGDLADVADGIPAKLVRRHPHVFGDAVLQATPARCATAGRSIKRDAGGPRGHLPRRARRPPGLLYARKVQRRAAAVGFDWERVRAEALARARRGARELRAALAGTAPPTSGRPDVPTRPATCCSRPSTCCAWRASTRSSRCAARRAASARGWRRRRRSRTPMEATSGVLGLDEQDGYYRRAKTDLEGQPLSAIESVHGPADPGLPR